MSTRWVWQIAAFHPICILNQPAFRRSTCKPNSFSDHILQFLFPIGWRQPTKTCDVFSPAPWCCHACRAAAVRQPLPGLQWQLVRLRSGRQRHANAAARAREAAGAHRRLLWPGPASSPGAPGLQQHRGPQGKRAAEPLQTIYLRVALQRVIYHNSPPACHYSLLVRLQLHPPYALIETRRHSRRHLDSSQEPKK